MKMDEKVGLSKLIIFPTRISWKEVMLTLSGEIFDSVDTNHYSTSLDPQGSGTIIIILILTLAYYYDLFLTIKIFI